MNQEFVNGKWQIRLDDGSVVSSSSFHCLWPHVANGWLFYLRGGNDNQYVAREIVTGTESVLVGVNAAPFEFVSDSVRAMIAVKLSQGKSNVWSECAAAIFDFVAGGWMDFSALPTLQVFRVTGVGQKPNWLWIKNGESVSGFEGNDPAGMHPVVRVTWLSTSRIEFVTLQYDNNNIFPIAFHLWQRDVAPTGMGPMQEMVVSWPVDRNNPTEPTWLHA